MKNSFARRNFRQMSPVELEIFGNDVNSGIYSNAMIFPAPTITEAEYTVLLSTYAAAYSQYKLYGITRKVDFLDTRDELLNTLDALATYVDSVADGNGSTIALAGFTPSSDVMQRTLPVDRILYFNTQRTDMPGQIVVEIPPIMAA